jgi:hypothetical protein
MEVKLSRHFGNALAAPTGHVFLKACLAAATYDTPEGPGPTSPMRWRVALRAGYYYEASLLEHALLAWPPSHLAAAVALLALRRQATGPAPSPGALLRQGNQASCAEAPAGGGGRRSRRLRGAAEAASRESVWTPRCVAVSGYCENDLAACCAAVVAEVARKPRETAHGRVLEAVKKKYSHQDRCLAVAAEAPFATLPLATPCLAPRPRTRYAAARAAVAADVPAGEAVERGQAARLQQRAASGQSRTGLLSPGLEGAAGRPRRGTQRHMM